MSNLLLVRGVHRRAGVAVGLIALSVIPCGPWDAQRAQAAIATLGNVTPTPPAGGGNVSAIFYVGDSSYGQLSVTASNPATPINVIGGNSSVFGDDARVTGTGAFTGFGNNFTIAEDLALGRAGSGNLSASGLSRVTASDDIILAIEDGSSGRLFVNDLGTIVEALDDIVVGEGGTALVQALSGSRVFAESTTVGQNATSDGTVTVSGNETTWLQSGSMTIGAGGRGYMQVVSQARMESSNALIGTGPGGVGSANVSGTGSIWDVNGTMTLGIAGQGAITITEGGRVNNSGAARMATLAGSEATALVSGVNSLWNAGPSLTVGELGSGVLRVLAGGRVNVGSTILAVNGGARGEVVVDGIGTVWDVTGNLDVGNVPGAEALVTVATGGVANVSGLARVGTGGDVFMGGGRLNVSAGLTNQGVVRGAGRINGAVGNAAAGEIRTQSGSALVLGSTLSNAGLVNLTGGELEILGATTNTGDIDMRSSIVRFGGGMTNSSGAQLAAVGGDVDVFGAIANAAGAEIVVGGGARAVFHDAVTGGGEFFVASDASLLMLEDLTFMPTSLLSLQLNQSILADEFTPVEVSGQATLAGELSVQLSSGFTPQLGDAYKLLTASSVSGTFASETLPALGAGLQWDVDYEPTSLTLSVVAGPGGIPSDFDGDGDVDGADLADWRNGFGTAPNATRGDGDADSDGDVDGADFLTWQRQLGSTTAAPAASAVPEPGSAIMLAAALAAVVARARRRP